MKKPIVWAPVAEASRKNAGKLRLDLVPFRWIMALAEVFHAGADKYGDSNWLAGMRFSRCWASALRHLAAWAGGERYDVETGQPHLVHAAWNLLAINDYEVLGRGLDDVRPLPPAWNPETEEH